MYEVSYEVMYEVMYEEDCKVPSQEICGEGTSKERDLPEEDHQGESGKEGYHSSCQDLAAKEKARYEDEMYEVSCEEDCKVPSQEICGEGTSKESDLPEEDHQGESGKEGYHSSRPDLAAKDKARYEDEMQNKLAKKTSELELK